MGPTFYRKGHFSSIAALLLLRHSSIAAAHNRKESAAIEEKWPFLLRRSSIAALRTRGSAPQLERFYTVPGSHLRVRKNRLWIVSPSIVVFSVDLVCKEELIIVCVSINHYKSTSLRSMINKLLTYLLSWNKLYGLIKCST